MKMWQQVAILWVLVGGPVMAAPPTGRADYRFGPGDVIEVTVSPQHMFDRTVTVQPDGKISYPHLGEVSVAGLTVAQLSERLRQGLNHDLVDPSVTVSLREAGKREVGRVSLLGAVHAPSTYDIKEGTSITEILAAAGGPAPDADLRHVTISHTDGSAMTADLSSTETKGTVDRTLTLRPGDIIIVPQGSPATVLVEGEVTKPGSYPIQRDSRLLDAVQQAGGMTEKADLHRVRVAHAGVPGSRSLDLQPLLAGGDASDPERNVRLQPGDTIFVPPTEQQVMVIGSVGKPNVYPLKPNERVLDALVEAGGAGDGSSQVFLVRKNGAGQADSKRLDLKKIMKNGDPNENQLLRPGDMIYVQDKRRGSGSGGLLNLLYPLTSVFYLFR